jgi:NADP-dependent 3-hydroxy acid dehydrogenase YdfG
VLARALKPEDIAQACLFVATLPARAHVPELTIVPAAL